MTGQVNYTMYKNEIEYLEKFRPAACTLDQLKKKNHLAIKELHKIVGKCLNEKVSQKSYEQCIKEMMMQGLIQETFSNDKKFRIVISPIGKEVHRTVSKTNEHLLSIAHS